MLTALTAAARLGREHPSNDERDGVRQCRQRKTTDAATALMMTGNR
jgi:hypothetical protein